MMEDNFVVLKRVGKALWQCEDKEVAWKVWSAVGCTAGRIVSNGELALFTKGANLLHMRVELVVIEHLGGTNGH